MAGQCKVCKAIESHSLGVIHELECPVGTLQGLTELETLSQDDLKALVRSVYDILESMTVVYPWR